MWYMLQGNSDQYALCSRTYDIDSWHLRYQHKGSHHELNSTMKRLLATLLTLQITKKTNLATLHCSQLSSENSWFLMYEQMNKYFLLLSWTPLFYPLRIHEHNVNKIKVLFHVLQYFKVFSWIYAIHSYLR